MRTSPSHRSGPARHGQGCPLHPRTGGHGGTWRDNPLRALVWNSDKTYLDDLAAAGVPTVPTGFVAPARPWAPPTGDFVIEPSVASGGCPECGIDWRCDRREALGLVAQVPAGRRRRDEGRARPDGPLRGGVVGVGQDLPQLACSVV